MSTTQGKRHRSLGQRIRTRGAIVRKHRHRLCTAISTTCRPRSKCTQRSCTQLGTISKDPIGFEAGDANLYRYVGNGPTGATDPNGLEHFPADHRGEWVSGKKGNGVFRYYDNEYNRNRKVANAEVRFRYQHIAIGGFPADWYYGGSAKYATVEIDKVLGTDVDFTKADKEMRGKLKNKHWQRPDGYIWNHAGDYRSRKLELVDYRHGAVAHQGSAAHVRAIARVHIGLEIFSQLADAVAHANSEFPDGKVVDAPYYFRDGKSVFVVNNGGWKYGDWPNREYIAGPKAGQKKFITSEKFAEYQSLGDAEFGRLRGNRYTGRWFEEGRLRDRINVEDEFGNVRGYIDAEGEHRFNAPPALSPGWYGIDYN